MHFPRDLQRIHHGILQRRQSDQSHLGIKEADVEKAHYG